MVFISVNYIFDCTKIVTIVFNLVYSDGYICNYINIQQKTIDDRWDKAAEINQPPLLFRKLLKPFQFQNNYLCEFFY